MSYWETREAAAQLADRQIAAAHRIPKSIAKAGSKGSH